MKPLLATDCNPDNCVSLGLTRGRDEIMTNLSATSLTELHQLFHQHFNLEGFRTLYLKLNVDYESVTGKEKQSWIRELLLALGCNGRLPELINPAQEERPHVAWPPLPDDFQLSAALASGTTAVI